MPDDPENKRKGSNKNMNAMWKTYYWLEILQASKMKTKNQLHLLPVQFVSPQFVCIVVLQRKSEWMSFLMKLISRLTGA